ncbi:MAG: ECF transporter S component [Candidatus Bathyarchaeota archaeon]|nr:ECF transporter S component [Candidatus Termiticorpusculum sp.]MCL1971307.1 ECF transporter S component [Candidatus Termiticorpusculum sp.]
MRLKSATKKHKISTFQIATAAIFAALVAVATIAFAFPITATSGYFNLGETVIYVAALLFGPFIGLIAGAGATIADIVLVPPYAPVTFVVKAVEGCLVGFLVKKLNSRLRNFTLCAVIAILIGGFEMITGYFIYETFVYGYGVALAELPVNIVQMLFGLVIAVPIMQTVLRVFPQLKNYLQEIH